MGGLKKYLENGKSWGVGGSYLKFPPWWGYGYFLELHNTRLNHLIASRNCFAKKRITLLLKRKKERKKERQKERTKERTNERRKRSKGLIIILHLSLITTSHSQFWINTWAVEENVVIVNISQFFLQPIEILHQVSSISIQSRL